MKKEIGLWIDHHKAMVVKAILFVNPLVTECISPIEALNPAAQSSRLSEPS